MAWFRRLLARARAITPPVSASRATRPTERPIARVSAWVLRAAAVRATSSRFSAAFTFSAHRSISLIAARPWPATMMARAPLKSPPWAVATTRSMMWRRRSTAPIKSLTWAVSLGLSATSLAKLVSSPGSAAVAVR